MAYSSNDQTEIASALSEDTGSNVTQSETVNLKENLVIKRNSLLQRFRKAVLIKSKAANMILLWSLLIHSLNGILDPNIIFLLPLEVSLKTSVYMNQNASVRADSISYTYVIGSGVYGAFAVWLLFYPLAGYLADVRYGRYKVQFKINMVCFDTSYYRDSCHQCCILAYLFVINSQTHGLTFGPDGSLLCYIVIMSLFGLFAYLMMSIGFAGFAANVIQFGIDQLQDLPARDSFFFIYWYVLVWHIGIGIGKLVWSTAVPSLFISLSVFLIGWLLLIIVIPVSLCVAKSRWFIRDTGLGNPYKEVARVVGFARRHKIPIRRSAFTYWEDDIPTGLDLGKSKYGGPFTTEQVENVKAFFGILFVLLSLGPFFTADIAASATLPVLRHHLDNLILAEQLYVVNSLFANGGTLYPMFIVILIPIFLKIIYPLFQKYMSSILRSLSHNSVSSLHVHCLLIQLATLFQVARMQPLCLNLISV